MASRSKAISDLMVGISELLESNFESHGYGGEIASKMTERDLKEILEKFGFEVEFIESDKEN